MESDRCGLFLPRCGISSGSVLCWSRFRGNCFMFIPLKRKRFRIFPRSDDLPSSTGSPVVSTA